MLVLSRKKDEIIDIDVPPSGNNTHVEIMVIEIRGDKVRLGIGAGREVVIHRREVTMAISKEMNEQHADARAVQDESTNDEVKTA